MQLIRNLGKLQTPQHCLIGRPSLHGVFHILVAASLNLKQHQMTFKYALYRVSRSYSLRLAIDDEAEKAFPNFSNRL